MSDEENGTERVTQLWPVDIKKRVQAKVGQRGVTRFTLEAVREKLAREEAQEIVKEAIGETPATDLPVTAVVEPPVISTPVHVVEREEPAVASPAVERVSKLIGDETRGADVAVQTMSTGAAKEYSSSQARVQAMLDKAAQMGVMKAVDLPVPPKPVVEEIAAPDEVIEEPAEEEFVEEPIPDDQPTLQETMRAMQTLPVHALPDAEPVSTPVQTRALDDIEVDF